MNASTDSKPASPSARSEADSHGGVVRIVLIYAIFAALWILFSDPLASFFFSHSDQLLLVNIIKGWVFVAVTTLLLYGLMRRRLGAAMPSATPGSRGPLLTFLALAAVIAALSTIAIKLNYRQHEAKESDRLKTIADLKTQQIGDWLKERHGTASILSTSPYFAENYQRWRAHGDSASRDRLQARLSQFLQDYGVSAIRLLDENGELKLGTSGGPHGIPRIVANAVRQASSDHKVALISPYRDATGQLHLDFIAPMVAVTGPVPSLVLHIEPNQWLFPTLQTWPIPSASGETLIFRRDGDHVQFLNELRHRSDTTAKLRMPISSEKLLAAQALRGAAKPGQIVEGVDYRQVPSMGMARTIPGTDWYLVVKMDRAEFYGAARQEAVWIALTGVLALFIVAAGLHLSRQRQALDLAARTSQAQNERLRALRLLAAIADSSEDAIIAKDLEGRYLLFNRAATEFTGKAAEEVLGKDDFFLFPPEEAKFLQALGSRAIEENRVFTDEEILTTPHGVRTFLATKGPLHDNEGKVIGLYGITRDITERKKTQEILVDQMNRFRLLLDNSRDGIIIIDQEHRIIEANHRFSEMLGYEPEELLQLHTWDFDATLSEKQIRSGFNDLQTSSRVFETRHRRKDGREYDVEVSVSGTRWADQDLKLCICRDISERKHIDDQLRLWANAFEYANFGLAITDARNSTYLSVNPTFARERGFSPEELLGKPVMTIYPEDQRETVKARIADLDASGHGVFESEHLCKDGRRFPVLMDITVVKDTQGKAISRVAYALDITERKRASEALLQQSEEMKRRNLELERFNRATVGRELDMIELKRRINALSAELGREPPFPLSFLETPDADLGKDAP
jgi:PAS domain S-box-containing protein